MTYALDLWARAREALAVAQANLPISPDASASRAYYAAFYGVSALLALEGKTFTKHSAVEAAVHRDLVKTGRLQQEFGRRYARLAELRTTGDYGGAEHVSAQAATEAVEMALQVLRAVQNERPEVLSPVD